jgi:hypothetical protein
LITDLSIAVTSMDTTERVDNRNIIDNDRNKDRSTQRVYRSNFLLLITVVSGLHTVTYLATNKTGMIKCRSVVPGIVSFCGDPLLQYEHRNKL